MLRKELQNYLDKVYPHSKIDAEHSLGGQVHIRFELGGELLANGTIERINQATERAFVIFNDTFQVPTNEIYILIYEYQQENIFSSTVDYLYKQFPSDYYSKFYSQKETVNTQYFSTQENRADDLVKEEVRIIIGKLPVKDINIKNILTGIARNEMGFEPAINQKIFFFDTLTDKAFYMYDDRGCFVWSDDAEKIRDIFLNRNDWIVPYHKADIEEFFK